MDSKAISALSVVLNVNSVDSINRLAKAEQLLSRGNPHSMAAAATILHEVQRLQKPEMKEMGLPQPRFWTFTIREIQDLLPTWVEEQDVDRQWVIHTLTSRGFNIAETDKSPRLWIIWDADELKTLKNNPNAIIYTPT